MLHNWRIVFSFQYPHKDCFGENTKKTPRKYSNMVGSIQGISYYYEITKQRVSHFGNFSLVQKRESKGKGRVFNTTEII